ncbi:hypothetical protein DFP73DRAFT_622255 [Morchella snyderi]|nr:hypothetical protein DFP73DRAFT_622255 [Morchella snyderi]
MKTQTEGEALAISGDGVVGRQVYVDFEPLSTPGQRSSGQEIVSYLEDGTEVTTFVMNSPTSHGSADSEGFRSPFRRDPSPPLTPSDADSIWRENQRHSDEIRNQISRLLSFDSTISERDETTHRQNVSLCPRSNSLEGSAENKSELSLIYASSDDSSNEVGKRSSSLHRCVKAGTRSLEKLHCTVPNLPSDSTEKPRTETRSRRSSSISMMAILAPSSKRDFASIGKTMTARLFISGSKACKKLVLRIGLFDIFARCAKYPHTSAGSLASSEASTLRTSINDFSARSDGRNYVLNSSSHAESIWSVEKDATVGVSSPPEESPAGESKGYGGLSPSKQYSRGISTTHESTMSDMSPKLKDSGCDRYLRLCQTSSEGYERLPTAGYYEDPSDPTSYYRPEHTQSDIDNDVPTPPSGRCVRPTCYTTMGPNTSVSRAWTVLRPGWKRELSSGSNKGEVSDQKKGKCQDISYIPTRSISVGSTGTVIKTVTLEEGGGQWTGHAADQMSTSASQVENLFSSDAAGMDGAANNSECGSASAVSSALKTFHEAHDQPRVFVKDISQLSTAPNGITQVVADPQSFNVPQEERAIQPEQPGVAVLSKDAEAVPVQESLDMDVTRKQSWLKQISLRVKASVNDLRKRDSGHGTVRRRR